MRQRKSFLEVAIVTHGGVFMEVAIETAVAFFRKSRPATGLEDLFLSSCSNFERNLESGS
jgi:hypothetical protein